jgi:hypothetical protein
LWRVHESGQQSSEHDPPSLQQHIPAGQSESSLHCSGQQSSEHDSPSLQQHSAAGQSESSLHCAGQQSSEHDSPSSQQHAPSLQVSIQMSSARSHSWHGPQAPSPVASWHVWLLQIIVAQPESFSGDESRSQSIALQQSPATQTLSHRM